MKTYVVLPAGPLMFDDRLHHKVAIWLAEFCGTLDDPQRSWQFERQWDADERVEFYRFVFDRVEDAMLFKLTWG